MVRVLNQVKSALSFKDLFKKENRISSTLSQRGKKEYLSYNILFIVLILLTAFPFWEFFCEICNIVGSIVSGTPKQGLVQLVRMLPLFLFVISLVYIGIYTWRAYRARDEHGRIKAWKVNGYISVGLGTIIFVYTIVGYLTKIYERFVEGLVTPLYPFDMIFAGLIVILFGIFSVVYSKKLTIKKSELPYVKGSNKKIIRGLDKVFYPISYLVGVGSLAAFIMCFWVMDWTHGYIIFNIGLMFTYFMAFLMVIFYRLIYCGLKDEIKKKVAIKVAVAVLAINLIFYIIYMVSCGVFPYAPNQNAFGLLPLEYTASFNAFWLLFGLNNIVGPIVALIKGIIRKK
ncbi:MAG: hypothetical protein MJ227_02840 [Bacilli bacterium]|nr:hypothetical protein [Bacilli bacterium]